MTERRYPSGGTHWRVQTRVDGRMRSKSFRTVDEANTYAATLPRGSRRSRSDVVYEVEFLTSLGQSLDAIAGDLGIKPTSLERSLRRAGRHDLARRR